MARRIWKKSILNTVERVSFKKVTYEYVYDVKIQRHLRIDRVEAVAANLHRLAVLVVEGLSVTMGRRLSALDDLLRVV